MPAIDYKRALLRMALLLLPFAARAQFTPASASPFPAGASPQAVATGDFNADGKPDLVTANAVGNNVTVLLGNGSGGFTEATGSPFAVGMNPQFVAVGDFNGDGKADIVAANSGDNTVTVLLGNGSGKFTQVAGSPFAVGSTPVFVGVGDFNGDGKADIVTANSGDNTVTVLLGNDTGGFTRSAGSPFSTGQSPLFVAVGDVNGDGRQDLVVANFAGNSLTILLGNGLGGFTATPASPVSVGAGPVAITLGDLNGDGKPDILAANSADNTATVLLGDGTGAFVAAAASPFAVGVKPHALALADFNGDGVPDVVAANAGGNSITVLLGDGSGGFTALTGSPFNTGSTPVSLVVADFNADGKPDIAIANLFDSNVTLLLNALPSITPNSPSLTLYAQAAQTAPVTFPVTVSAPTAGSTYTVSSNKAWLTPAPASSATGGATTVSLSASAGSLTPGVYSAIVRYSAPGFFDGATSVTFHVATASGTLQPSASNPFATGSSPQSVAVADFNGDGFPDLATADYGSNTVSILLGNASGGFTAAPGSPFAVGTTPSSIAVADFNGDGLPDVVTANPGSNNVSVLLGNGMGGMTPAPGSPYATGVEPVSVAVGDVNGDGKPDILTANLSDQTVTVLLGSGTGGFAAATGNPVALGSSPQSIAVADFNGDGLLDFVTPAFNGKVTILYGNGTGEFAGARPFTAGSFPQFVAAADLNGGGRLDIVTVNGNSTVTVLLANNSGGYTAATGSPFAVGKLPQSVAVADMNGDGKPDLITGNAEDNTISVLLGNGSGGFTTAPGSPFAGGTTPFSVAVADFNGDGRPDVAITNLGSGGVSLLFGAQATTTSVLSTTAAASVVYGASVPLSLKVTSAGFNAPTGTATFFDSSTTLGTAAQMGSPFTYMATGLAAGSHMLTASYGGDNASNISTSNTVALTVTQASQTITFGALSTKSYGIAPFAVSGTASSSLALSFASTTSSVCTVSGGMVTILSVGSCTVEASQPGNNNYLAATPVDQKFAVTQASQTITFTTLPNLQIGSPPFALTATASSGLAVAFTSTTTPICTVAAGIVTMLAAGTCTIQATQPGNVDYTAAPSVSQHFSVTPASQSITFGPLSNAAFGTAPFALSATATSGLAVTFASTTSAVCTVSGINVTLVSVGTCAIQASQAGNSTYAAATPVSQSFLVTQGSQSITFAALPNKSFGSAPFALSATASSGLAVAFTSSTTSVCTVSGTNATLVTGGLCTIQAAQAGNTNYAAATPVSQSFTIMPGNQTIAFSALAAKAMGSPPFAVNATATSALPVSFASTTAAVCTVAGAIVTVVSVGTCMVEASQAGNSNYNAATPVDQSFSVTPAAQTIAFPAPANIAMGSPPFTLNATASSGLTVAFASTTAPVCTVSGATATLVSVGTCTIQATQPGNANYNAASAVSRSFMVTPQSQSITFASLSSQIVGAAPITISATASSGLTVIFTSSTVSVCTVSGSTVTLVTVGTCTIQAAQPGNSAYAAAASVSQSFTISPTGQTITFPTIPSKAFGSGTFTLTATASSGLAVTFTSTTASVCTVSGTTVTLVSVGICTLQANQAGNGSYGAAPTVSQQFSVTAASQTITFASLPGKTFGTGPVPVSATSSSSLPVAFASTTPATCTVTGTSVTLVSAGTCTVEASQAGNANYGAATPVDQSFTIAPANQTITFGTLTAQTFGPTPVTVSATASSKLAVNFASTTMPVCAVSGAAVTLVSLGTCTIEATQPGNANYNAATAVDRSFMVTQGSQTITFPALTSQSISPTPVPLSATASSGLTVNFGSASPLICTVSGAAATLIAVGSCNIQATQPGNANYAAAMPVNQSFNVTQGGQTIAFTPVATQAFSPTPVAITATATSGLTVSLLSSTPGVCTMSSTGATLTGLGTCTIQATQAGNVNYSAAPAISLSFMVTQGNQTIMFPAIPNVPLGATPFAVSATASSGLTVVFSSTTPSICRVTGATVTVLTVGQCAIQAAQAGNADYGPAAPVSQSFTVGPAVMIVSVANAASYATAALAADGYTVAFGSNFATTSAQAASLILPTTLAGAVVSITDSKGLTMQAPLYYVSPGQINFVVPEGLTPGSATLKIVDAAGSNGSFPITLAAVSPALFTADASGTGAPAAIAYDYDNDGATQAPPVFTCSTSPPLVCTPSPIDLGPASINVFLALFGTGIRGRSSLSGVSVTLGGVPLQVYYAGAQNTYPGLDQVNVLLAHSLAGKGQLVLQMTVDGVAANPVLVQIK